MMYEVLSPSLEGCNRGNQPEVG